jgi:hypothetical protein
VYVCSFLVLGDTKAIQCQNNFSHFWGAFFFSSKGLQVPGFTVSCRIVWFALWIPTEVYTVSFIPLKLQAINPHIPALHVRRCTTRDTTHHITYNACFFAYTPIKAKKNEERKKQTRTMGGNAVRRVDLLIWDDGERREKEKEGGRKKKPLERLTG